MGDVLLPSASEYLDFVDESIPGRKTRLIAVYSSRHGDLLGHIRWFGRWRQYAFFPAAETIWNPACLSDVSLQIGRLMAERRAA